MQLGFGAGVLVGTPIQDVNGNTIANPTPIKFGVLQEVTLDIEFTTKELYGALNFPVAIGRGQGKITGGAKSAQIDGLLWSSLFFGQTNPALTMGQLAVYYDTAGEQVPSGTVPTAPTGVGSTTGGTVAAASYYAKVVYLDGAGDVVAVSTESAVVTTTGSTSSIAWTFPSAASVGAARANLWVGTAPGAENSYFAVTGTAFTQIASAGTSGTLPTDAASSITVVPPNSGVFVADLGVSDSNGNPMTAVASAPTSGQYTVSAAGVYTFSAADAGKTVFTNYRYSVVNTTTPFPAKQTLNAQLMGYSPTFAIDLAMIYKGQQMTIHLYQCTSSKLSLQTKLEDFLIPDFSFAAFADSQNRVLDWSTTSA